MGFVSWRELRPSRSHRGPFGSYAKSSVSSSGEKNPTEKDPAATRISVLRSAISDHVLELAAGGGTVGELAVRGTVGTAVNVVVAIAEHAGEPSVFS